MRAVDAPLKGLSPLPGIFSAQMTSSSCPRRLTDNSGSAVTGAEPVPLRRRLCVKQTERMNPHTDTQGAPTPHRYTRHTDTAHRYTRHTDTTQIHTAHRHDTQMHTAHQHHTDKHGTPTSHRYTRHTDTTQIHTAHRHHTDARGTQTPHR